jgi:hypothetical protein
MNAFTKAPMATAATNTSIGNRDPRMDDPICPEIQGLIMVGVTGAAGSYYSMDFNA